MFADMRQMFLLMLLGFAPIARANADWLIIHDASTCATEPDALALRIQNAIAGVQNPALQIDVELVGDRRAAAATVRLLRGPELVGLKRIEACSCDEALDAVALVAAFALSSSPQQAATAPVESPVAATASSATRAPARASAPIRSLTVSSSRVDASAAARPLRPWRVLFGLGVDARSLAQPTLLAAAGAARSLGRGELRVHARYGAPSTEERVEVASALTRLRSDFAAGALDYCLGLDRARWLSLCAGLEVRWTRWTRVQEALGKAQVKAQVEKRRLESSLSPTAGLALVLRDVLVQPQLELSAQVPVVGAPTRLGLRAMFGGGMPF